MVAATTDQQPHSNEIEEALLGSLLIDPDAVIRIAAIGLASDDFWSPAHQAIYKTVQELVGHGTAIDYTTVGNALDQSRHNGQTFLEYVGGWPKLSRLITKTPTTVHVTDYATQLKALSFRRKLIVVSGRLAGMGFNHSGTLEQAQQDAMRMFADAIHLEDGDSHLYGTDDLMTAYLVNQERRAAQLKADPYSLVTTPWPDVNRYIPDVGPGIVHLIAARPGVGKTIYLENVAEFNATRGKTVAFYHLELDHQFMMDRRVCRHSGVTYDELRHGYNGPALGPAIDRINEWKGNVTLIHCPSWPVERIMADAVRLNAEGKADIVLIDYLQKIPVPDVRNRNEWGLVGRVVGSIKDAAERLKIPVFLACQVIREMERRGDTAIPRMSDLYGGTFIESFCNQIVILHSRQDTAQEEQDDYPTGSREVYIVKNTQGATGKAELVHFRRQYRFESLRRAA